VKQVIWLCAAVMICGVASAEPQASGISLPLPERAHTIVQTFVDAHVFQGVVLIAVDGNVVFERAYGKALYEFDVDNAVDTRFQIASVSKPFTAAAILLLAERGLVDLDAPLHQVLPDYPNGERLTLDHLLTHTSGIPNINSFDNYAELQLRHYENAASLVDVFKDKPLEGNPGESFAYSNSNYELLAHVIEVVTEMSYAKFLSANIFEPLGMNDTGHRDNPEAIIPRLAAGYAPVGALDFGRAPYLDWTVKTGNGSLYSTVHDLLRFHEALQGTALLSSASLERAYGFGRDLGSGWFPGEQFGKRVVTMTGRSPGYVAYFQRFIDDDRCLIILSNLYLGPPSQMRSALSALMMGEHSDAVEFTLNTSSSEMDSGRFVGNYQFGEDWYVGEVAVKVEDRVDHLAVVYTNGKNIGYEFLLVPMGPGRFFDRTHGGIVRFEPIEETASYRLLYEYGSTKIALPID
jgi:CubicO group peptidase (beta-lactamase class C family)